MAVEHVLAIIDYVILAVILALCAGIGIYFGCSGNKQSTKREYLLANRKMHFFPVAASIMASTNSAIAALGTGAEVYSYSSIVCWLPVGLIVLTISATHLYLPVFYNLGITSIYEVRNLMKTHS